jgi:hypothetical protein
MSKPDAEGHHHKQVDDTRIYFSWSSYCNSRIKFNISVLLIGNNSAGLLMIHVWKNGMKRPNKSKANRE